MQVAPDCIMLHMYASDALYDMQMASERIMSHAEGFLLHYMYDMYIWVLITLYVMPGWLLITLFDAWMISDCIM